MDKDLLTKKEKKAVASMMSYSWPVSCAIIIACLALLALVSIALVILDGSTIVNLINQSDAGNSASAEDLMRLLQDGARGLVMVGIFAGALFAMILAFAVREYGIIIRKIAEKNPDLIGKDSSGK